MEKLQLPPKQHLKTWKQVDPDGILIGPQSSNAVIAPPTHPLVEVDFDEIDMTACLNWLMQEDLDILVFA